MITKLHDFILIDAIESIRDDGYIKSEKVLINANCIVSVKSMTSINTDIPISEIITRNERYAIKGTVEEFYKSLNPYLCTK